MRKLTEGQQIEIVSDYIAGHFVTVIAKRYGVSDSYPTMLAKKLGYGLRTKERNRRGWERAERLGSAWE